MSIAVVESLQKIGTHLSKHEKSLLTALVKNLPQNASVVEVGSYLGASTCFLAYGLQDIKGSVYAVDSWKNMAMTEGERDTYDEFKTNTEPFKHIIKPLRGLSVEMAKDFKEQIDLLFVDGDHSYEGVKADLEAWLSKLKDGATIVFHDYSWAEGVHRAVREYVLPIQTEPGRKLDSIYWTRVAPSRRGASAINITVAIPTYKRSHYVMDALNSVLAQGTELSYEVLVLDNACDGSLREEVEATARNSKIPVRYIPVQEIGLHNGRNVAALEGNGELIVYLDDDVIVPPSWLNEICSPFDDPEIGAVGGKVDPQWEGEKPDWLDGVPGFYFSLLDKGSEQTEMNWPSTAPHGCNMAIRRSLILELDGFPPDGIGQGRIPWKRGDGEWGFFREASKAGVKVVYQPTAGLLHRIPASRLTRAAVRKRALKEAILNGYMDIRTKSHRRRSLFKQGVIHLIKSGRAVVRKITHPRALPKYKLRSDIKAIHELYIGIYKLRAVFDSGLREWALKESYWPQRFYDESNRE